MNINLIRSAHHIINTKYVNSLMNDETAGAHHAVRRTDDESVGANGETIRTNGAAIRTDYESVGTNHETAGASHAARRTDDETAGANGAAIRNIFRSKGAKIGVFLGFLDWEGDFVPLVAKPRLSIE